MSYQLKGDAQLGNQLKVVELILPMSITANATPASVSLDIHDSGVLKFEPESTSAAGATDISAYIYTGQTLTVTTSHDINGIALVLVDVGQPIRRLISIECRNRRTGAVVPTLFCTAPAAGLIGVDSATASDAVVFEIDSSVNFATTDAHMVFRVCVELDN